MTKRLLSQTTVENIHQKVLETLETVGIRFENDEALEMFRKRGAKIDGNIVYLSEDLVNEALSLLPDYEYPSVTQQSITGQLFFGVPVMLDDETGEYRGATVADAVQMYKLGETSDLYEGSSIAVVDPHDNDGDDKFISQVAMLLKHSDKYIINGLRAHSSNTKNGDVYTSAYKGIKLIKDFYGITEDGNIMSQVVCPNSPFTYDEECLLNMKATAMHGQSVMLCPCSLQNLTGPGSNFGVNIHDLAMSIAGIAYIQFLRPGSDVSLSTCSVPTDMRSLQPVYGTPEAVYIAVVFYEMSKFYKISCGICALLSDSSKIDYQSGVESLLTTILPFQLTDIDIAYCYPGLMASFSCGSFIKAIYDEELMRYVNRIFKGINQEIDPGLMDTLEYGMNNGNFLTGKSLKNFKDENYLTKIFDKNGFSLDPNPEWQDSRTKAKKEINRRLEMYQFPERTATQKKLLQEYLPSQCKY